MKIVCFYAIAHTEIFPELILQWLCLLFNMNQVMKNHCLFNSQWYFNDRS